MQAAIVNVELGIDKCVEVVDKILSRRQERKEDFWANLRDDLDANSEIIKTLDNLFIDLVSGFTNREITGNSILLRKHVEATRVYLMARQLLPTLEELTGTISGVAFDSRYSAKRYQELVLTLRTLVRRLNRYRYELGNEAMTGVGQTQDWNLETLCERALGYDYGGGKVERAIEEMAEEVFRNHDFDLSDNIHRLIGQAKHQTRTVAL